MSLFSVCDNTVLKDKRLSPTERIVYQCLCTYMNRDTGICFPRYATLGADLGLSRTVIWRAVKKLESLKLLTIKRLASTNQYFLERQKQLQETRMFRIRTTNVSYPQGINKTNNINYNSSKGVYNYNKFNKSPPLANHSSDTIVYRGKELKFCGSEGHYLHFTDKQGNIYEKHSFDPEKEITLFKATDKGVKHG